MKKQRFFMLGIITVLVAVLSLTFVSSTFAKYTTSDTAKDEARVAKWGVAIETKLDDLFEVAYDNATGTVQAAGTYNILAPGTTDLQEAAFKISGTPEVKVEVAVTADVTLTGWEVEGSVYCPLIIKVNDTEFKIDSTNTTTDILEEAIENAIKEALGNGQHDAKSNLNKTVKVSWEWPFEVGANADEKAANNAKDTALGNAAEAGNAPKFGLDVTVIVSQID